MKNKTEQNETKKTPKPNNSILGESQGPKKFSWEKKENKRKRRVCSHRSFVGNPWPGPALCHLELCLIFSPLGGKCHSGFRPLVAI